MKHKSNFKFFHALLACLAISNAIIGHALAKDDFSGSQLQKMLNDRQIARFSGQCNVSYFLPTFSRANDKSLKVLASEIPFAEVNINETVNKPEQKSCGVGKTTISGTKYCIKHSTQYADGKLVVKAENWVASTKFWERDSAHDHLQYEFEATDSNTVVVRIHKVNPATYLTAAENTNNSCTIHLVPVRTHAEKAEEADSSDANSPAVNTAE